ncbi:MAG: DinB family protein [Ferruginibacter sp.]
MKQLLQQYAAYNYWANQKITNVVSGIDDEQLHREIVSSFNSIYKTLVHYWGAESIWLLRMQEVSQKNIPALSFAGTGAELNDNIIAQSGLWKKWVHEITEEELLKNLSYKNLAGESFVQPVYILVNHVFNHSTYHRGQIVTMLRQVGVTTIPSTDFTTFTRLNIKD